ncbi:sugar ABC transporter substrate-binding protein [Humibacter antri]
MKRSSIAGALAVLAASALMITGCSSGGSSGAKHTTVTIMTWETAQTNALIDKALADFHDPGITVKRLDTPSGDYSAKLSSLTQAQKLPDLFWCGNDTEQQYSAIGLLTDWSGKLKSGSSLDDKSFGTSLANWKTKSGQIGGLPSLLNTYGIWYNADAFKAAGLAIPAAGWTWDEMYADAAALSNKNGATFGLHWAPGTDTPFALGNYSVSAGGKAFTDSTNAPTKVQADAAYTKAVQQLADAIKAGSVTPPGYDDSNATSLFSAGKVPMLEGGQWLAASFMTDKPKVDYGFAPFPVAQKGADFVTTYDAVGICTPKTTANPDADFKVLQYLEGTVFGKVLSQTPVAPPAYVKAQPSYFKALSSMPPSIESTVKADLGAKHLVGIRFTPTWAPKVNQVTTAKFLPILEGKAPISTLPDYVSQVNDIIKQNR